MILNFLSFAVNADIQSDIKDLIKKHHFQENSMGIYVEDSGKGIVEINSARLMIPASLTKIITGAASLELTSLNKKFVTELRGESVPVNGSLKSDLCLKGGGDPAFVSEKMWFLVNELTRHQLSNVEGNIIVDSSRFDDELFDKGRDDTRVDRAYDAPISALSFNWNSVNIFVKPGELNKSAKVFLDPKSDYLELVNQTKTVAKSGINSISANRVKNGEKDKIIVSGNISQNANEVVIYKSISNPPLWAGDHLKEFLNQRGIKVKGVVKTGICSTTSQVLATVQSKNYNEMIADMLKFSNNFVAEMLVKNIAADDLELKGQKKSATMKEGIDLLKNYLTDLGIDKKDYTLVNVSGLTRDNQLTAIQLAKVLSHVKNNFHIFPEFTSGLPIAGVDGTMKNRLKGDEGKWVRAKTGYLDGIIGLAGYIGRPNKEPLVFVMMFNGGFDQGLAARSLFDEMIKQLQK